MSACRQALCNDRTAKLRRIRITMSLLLSMTCVCAVAQELPKVAVLSTGGTIASRQDPVKGGYVPVLSAEDLVATVPAIRKIAQIQTEQISNIPSQDITPEIWLRTLSLPAPSTTRLSSNSSPTRTPTASKSFC